ncbi:signal peptidase I [Candidatus Methylacidithermus pantelleriae]|uniref:Signal peptidase I n=1 Tax=Candidatus Methylacidithermus pantelleriae TaxID=2744239 RepID=A0A8J2BT10_9BACT|nr:signal peptidase I [Candidatus Methylacidithermus pantelleriae]CAF0705265.1 Signal peptidase I [Candidatus Methylacidithermus pantelleriae]
MSFWQDWKARLARRRAVVEGKHFYRFFKRQRLYFQHRWNDRELREILQYEQELGIALQEGDPRQLPPLVARGEKLAGRFFPSSRWQRLQENVEVGFVAITVALAIRSYVLQPFKIPTDSMKPTLYGIQLLTPPKRVPGFLERLWERAVFGRTYHTIVFEKGGTLLEMREGQLSPWFEYTDLVLDSGERKRIWVPSQVLATKGGVFPGMNFAPGTKVSFVLQTGDQVLVNKWIYYFRQPRKGDPFVFKTMGIEDIEFRLRERGIEGSQYYIKRCVGTPGDRISLQPPYLLINGSPYWSHKKMREIMEKKDGYHGYVVLPGQKFLRSPQEVYVLGPKQYWAMGDNSPDSLDSRFWGPVPKQNVVGEAVWVYWPLGPRWGLIR